MALRFGLEDDDDLLCCHTCIGAACESLAEIMKALGQSPVVELTL
jgi:hypothetical protein